MIRLPGECLFQTLNGIYIIIFLEAEVGAVTPEIGTIKAHGFHFPALIFRRAEPPLLQQPPQFCQHIFLILFQAVTFSSPLRHIPSLFPFTVWRKAHPVSR